MSDRTPDPLTPEKCREIMNREMLIQVYRDMSLNIQKKITLHILQREYRVYDHKDIIGSFFNLEEAVAEYNDIRSEDSNGLT